MRKLPGKIDGELITREFFPNYVGNVECINWGECYVWAYIAYHIYEDVALFSNESHAFPYQRGLFFDSESSNGIENLEYLNCNRTFHERSSSTWEQDEEEFVDYWEDNGCFENVEMLDERIDAFLYKYNRKAA